MNQSYTPGYATRALPSWAPATESSTPSTLTGPRKEKRLRQIVSLIADRYQTLDAARIIAQNLLRRMKVNISRYGSDFNTEFKLLERIVVQRLNIINSYKIR